MEVPLVFRLEERCHQLHYPRINGCRNQYEGVYCLIDRWKAQQYLYYRSYARRVAISLSRIDNFLSSKEKTSGFCLT